MREDLLDKGMTYSHASFCHTFCADTLLAHCRPRSCGRQRAKAITKQKDMPKANARQERKNALSKKTKFSCDRSNLT